MNIVACGHDPAANAPNPDALDAAITEHRASIAALDALVREGRDVVACADAALDTALRERDRTIWELEQLRALIVPEQE